MRIITERKLRKFIDEASGAEKNIRENAITEWIRQARIADWKNYPDVKTTFNATDVYKNCVIFDVGGNKYRIIAKIGYRIHVIFIRFVLTHPEYDKNKWCDDCK